MGKRGGALTDEQKAQIARLGRLAGGNDDSSSGAAGSKSGKGGGKSGKSGSRGAARQGGSVEVIADAAGNRRERREAAKKQTRDRSRSPGGSVDVEGWAHKAAEAKRMAAAAKDRQRAQDKAGTMQKLGI